MLDATGCTEAERLTSMFELHHTRLVRHLVARLGRYDFHLAQDLAGETWARAVRDVHACRADADQAYGWLRAIAAHVVVDHYRLCRNRREAAVDFTGPRAYDLPPAPAAEDVALATERILAMLTQATPELEVAA